VVELLFGVMRVTYFNGINANFQFVRNITRFFLLMNFLLIKLSFHLNILYSVFT